MQAYARIFTAMAVKDSGGAAEVDDLLLGFFFRRVSGLLRCKIQICGTGSRLVVFFSNFFCQQLNLKR